MSDQLCDTIDLLRSRLDASQAEVERLQAENTALVAAAHDILEGWPNNDAQFDRGMDALVAALPDVDDE